MDKKISVKVCLGTTCFVMGSANLQELIEMVPKKYGEKVDVSGVPCLGLCSIDWEFSKAPYVKVDDEVIKEATVEKMCIRDRLPIWHTQSSSNPQRGLPVQLQCRSKRCNSTHIRSRRSSRPDW